MNLRDEVVEWIRVGTLVAIWIAFLYVAQTGVAISWDAVKQLPSVISIYAVFYYIFSKWLWRLPFLQGWLVPFPELQGTWQGEIRSTWKHPITEKELPPIPVLLVIKQTFLSISCAMHTRESDSFSTAAKISQDDSGVLRLSFNYTNRPKVTVRDQIPMHDGAATLRIVARGHRRTLQGEYWTNRRTTGEISVRFRSRILLDDYPVAFAPAVPLARKAS